MDGQTPDFMRKSPSQKRSEATISTLLDATSQLLAEGSLKAVTTNRIAERAGFSIGTLYQYFADRDGILIALAARTRERIAGNIVAEISQVDTSEGEPNVRAIVRALLCMFSEAPYESHLSHLLEIARLEGSDIPSAITQVEHALADKFSNMMEGSHSQPNVSAFVLTRAIMGAIRAALRESPELLTDANFENNLCRLAEGFLKS